eukprot:4599298-Alexandrium_andersonii.AAC.1
MCDRAWGVSRSASAAALAMACDPVRGPSRRYRAPRSIGVRLRLMDLPPIRKTYARVPQQGYIGPVRTAIRKSLTDM